MSLPGGRFGSQCVFHPILLFHCHNNLSVHSDSITLNLRVKTNTTLRRVTSQPVIDSWREQETDFYHFKTS